MTNMDYSNTLYVSELPLEWSGCNGMYVRHGVYNGHPKYTMDSHWYLGIEFRRMKIVYDKCWKLCTDDFTVIIVAKGPSTDLPSGEWHECLVK